MNLTPVEHFLAGSVLISADLAKKSGKKCSTGQRFICTEVNSYKIHILGTLDKYIMMHLNSSQLPNWIYKSFKSVILSNCMQNT